MSRWPGDATKEITTFGRLSRSCLMARILGTGNETTEERLVALLRAARLVGWRRHEPLPGKPDFSWRKERVAVFVDGCFWHGHNCGRSLTPKTNVAAWRLKIDRTKERDRQATSKLKHRGWIVVRIWECYLNKRPASAIGKIRRAIRGSKSN